MRSLMLRIRTGLAVTAVMVFGMFGYQTFAHHSFPATYVVDADPVQIEGELVAFMFRNPHSFVHVRVQNEDDDEAIRFAVEWAGAAALGRFGITRATLRPGDVVVITGLPGRNPEENRMLMKTIERPSDGWRWGFADDETFE